MTILSTPRIAVCFSTSSAPLSLRPRPLCSRSSLCPVRISPVRATPSRLARPPGTPVRATPQAFFQPGNLPRRLPPTLETLLLVNIVPFLWGTYAPSAKIMTQLNPHVPLALLNLITAVVSVGSLAFIRAIAPDPDEKPTPFRVSAELGTWLCLGALLHLRSIALTTPSRSSFFVQLTTLFVPAIEYLTGAKLSSNVIAAAGTTIAGAAFLAAPSDSSAATSFFSSLNAGDLVAIASAFFYSLHIIRIEKLAPKAGSPMSVVDGMIRAQVVCSLAFEMSVLLSGDPASTAFLRHMPHLSMHDTITSLICILWIGGATSALAMWAQVVGQARVGASRAAVFYASQPVWAVGLTVASGLDKLSQSEVIGGALIVLGGFLVALGDNGMEKR